MLFLALDAGTELILTRIEFDKTSSPSVSFRIKSHTNNSFIGLGLVITQDNLQFLDAEVLSSDNYIGDSVRYYKNLAKADGNLLKAYKLNKSIESKRAIKAALSAISKTCASHTEYNIIDDPLHYLEHTKFLMDIESKVRGNATYSSYYVLSRQYNWDLMATRENNGLFERDFQFCYGGESFDGFTVTTDINHNLLSITQKIFGA